MIHPEGTETREDYRSADVTFIHNYINGISRGADMHNPFDFPPYVPPPGEGWSQIQVFLLSI